jgi:hypothetical protein
MANTLLSNEQRITEMAAHIHRAITASTCSGIFGGSWLRPMFPLDLLLYSHSECEERRHWLSRVIGRAYREGVLLDGAL